MRSAAFLLAAVSAGLLVAGTMGCDQPSAGVRQDARKLTELEKLQDENQRLKTELAQKSDQMAEQAKTIESLRGLEGARSLDRIVHVERVDIDRLSGGYDANRDGIDDGVAVYLTLFDQYGGAMRASGTAKVTVLDLTDPAKPKTIAESSWDEESLGKNWYGGFLTAQYTLKVAWPEGMTKPPAGQLTVILSFTDLLTGKALSAQRVVSVTGFGVAPH